MAKLSKRQKKIAESVDTTRLYGVDEAIEVVKANATTKFDETVEIALNLGVVAANNYIPARTYGFDFIVKF